MLGKQIFLDIVIILSIPILIIGVYFLSFRDSNSASLSVTSEILKSDPNAPGTRTKLALQTLNTIALNDSLFRDPAFLSLRKYPVEIPTAELMREYPFTPAPEVQEMLRRAKSSSPPASAVKAESISVKLDMLKSSVTK